LPMAVSKNFVIAIPALPNPETSIMPIAVAKQRPPGASPNRAATTAELLRSRNQISRIDSSARAKDAVGEMPVHRPPGQIGGDNYTVGRPNALQPCPLSGVKRTSRLIDAMSAFDPKQTWLRSRLDATNGTILDTKM
jgi:hypothetical protein